MLTRQCRQVSSSVLPFLPLFLRASVVQGKKRGGKELGIPTGKITLLHVTPCLQTVYGAGQHLLTWYKEVQETNQYLIASLLRSFELFSNVSHSIRIVLRNTVFWSAVSHARETNITNSTKSALYVDILGPKCPQT